MPTYPRLMPDIKDQIEDQSKKTNNKIDWNHKICIPLLSKADAKVIESARKISARKSWI